MRGCCIVIVSVTLWNKLFLHRWCIDYGISNCWISFAICCYQNTARIRIWAKENWQIPICRVVNRTKSHTFLLFLPTFIHLFTALSQRRKCPQGHFFALVEPVSQVNPSRIRALNAHSKEFLPCSHRIKSAMRGHIPHSGILRNAEHYTSPHAKAEQNMQNEFRVANSRPYYTLFMDSWFFYSRR